MDLHSIIERLENPQVRLEDNSAFRCDNETIGILYSNIVSTAALSYSPGLFSFRHKGLSADVMEGFKKRFQVVSRNFFYERLGQLELRKANAAFFREEYFPKRFREDCIPQSIEYKVMKLAQEGEFTQIGAKIKEGAEAYHIEMIRQRKPNYSFVAEYNEILTALS